MVPPMDQEAVEEAMDDTTDGSGSDRRNDGWFKRCKRWIRKKSCERWMVQAMDQKAVEGAMDQGAFETVMDQEAIDGSESSRNSDHSKQRWIRTQSKERWMVPPMDQEATERAMGVWIKKQSKVR